LTVRSLWPPIIGLSAAVVAALVYADIQTPVRPVVVLWFLFVCPGMAMLQLLRLDDQAMKLAIAVALSVAFDTIVAIGFVYAGWANFDAMFTVILNVTLVALGIDVALELRRSGTPHR